MTSVASRPPPSGTAATTAVSTRPPAHPMSTSTMRGQQRPRNLAELTSLARDEVGWDDHKSVAHWLNVAADCRAKGYKSPDIERSFIELAKSADILHRLRETRKMFFTNSQLESTGQDLDTLIKKMNEMKPDIVRRFEIWKSKQPQEDTSEVERRRQEERRTIAYKQARDAQRAAAEAEEERIKREAARKEQEAKEAREEQLRKRAELDAKAREREKERENTKFSKASDSANAALQEAARERERRRRAAAAASNAAPAPASYEPKRKVSTSGTATAHPGYSTAGTSAAPSARRAGTDEEIVLVPPSTQERPARIQTHQRSRSNNSNNLMEPSPVSGKGSSGSYLSPNFPGNTSGGSLGLGVSPKPSVSSSSMAGVSPNLKASISSAAPGLVRQGTLVDDRSAYGGSSYGGGHIRGNSRDRQGIDSSEMTPSRAAPGSPTRATVGGNTSSSGGEDRLGSAMVPSSLTRQNTYIVEHTANRFDPTSFSSAGGGSGLSNAATYGSGLTNSNTPVRQTSASKHYSMHADEPLTPAAAAAQRRHSAQAPLSRHQTVPVSSLEGGSNTNLGRQNSVARQHTMPAGSAEASSTTALIRQPSNSRPAGQQGKQTSLDVPDTVHSLSRQNSAARATATSTYSTRTGHPAPAASQPSKAAPQSLASSQTMPARQSIDQEFRERQGSVPVISTQTAFERERQASVPTLSDRQRVQVAPVDSGLSLTALRMSSQLQPTAVATGTSRGGSVGVQPPATTTLAIDDRPYAQTRAQHPQMLSASVTESGESISSGSRNPSRRPSANNSPNVLQQSLTSLRSTTQGHMEQDPPQYNHSGYDPASLSRAGQSVSEAFERSIRGGSASPNPPRPREKAPSNANTVYLEQRQMVHDVRESNRRKGIQAVIPSPRPQDYLVSTSMDVDEPLSAHTQPYQHLEDQKMLEPPDLAMVDYETEKMKRRTDELEKRGIPTLYPASDRKAPIPQQHIIPQIHQMLVDPPELRPPEMNRTKKPLLSDNGSDHKSNPYEDSTNSNPSTRPSSGAGVYDSPAEAWNGRAPTPRRNGNEFLPTLPLQSPRRWIGDDSSADENGKKIPLPREKGFLRVDDDREFKSVAGPPALTTTSARPADQARIPFTVYMNGHQKGQGYTPSVHALVPKAEPPESIETARFLWNSASVFNERNLNPQNPYPRKPGKPSQMPVQMMDARSQEESARLRPANPQERVAAELRKIEVPSDVLKRFTAVSAANTELRKETLGLMMGKSKGNKFVVTTLLIPRQRGGPDWCIMEDEETVLQFQERRFLVTLGWIHTHPTQSCFMSSCDLHSHAPYQKMLPEAFAIVCAPTKQPNYGVFRLTNPHGLQFVLECKNTEMFHEHQQGDLYTDCDKGHVTLKDGIGLEICDIREMREIS